MSDNAIFADVFNQFMFHGEEVLASNSLSPVDTAFFTVPYGEAGTDVAVQRFRDVMRLGIAKKNNDAVYLLLGIENQSELHFAMPVRNMLYDALAYTSQVEATAKAHRAKQKKLHVSSAEYLSGVYRNAEIDQFKTSFREVMLFIKYSKDKQKLDELVTGDDVFRKMDRKAARVMSSVTGSNLQFDEEEMVDMCLAIDGIREEAVEMATIEIAQRMLQAGKYAFEEIAAISGLAIEKVRELQSETFDDVQ